MGVIPVRVRIHSEFSKPDDLSSAKPIPWTPLRKNHWRCCQKYPPPGLCWWPSNFELSSPTKISSLKYPAYKISSLKYPACKISSLKYPAFKISRFQTKRLNSSLKFISKNPVNECNASIIPFNVCGNVVVPLVYNLNFRAVAALVVMHECHRTLHTFINYLNNSLPWRHYRTANSLFNFPPVARERC